MTQLGQRQLAREESRLRAAAVARCYGLLREILLHTRATAITLMLVFDLRKNSELMTSPIRRDYYVPERGTEYCDERVCALSVCEHISGTTIPNFIKLSAHVTHDRGSVLLWRRCDMLCTSGLWTTLYLHIMGYAKKEYIQSNSPGGSS